MNKKQVIERVPFAGHWEISAGRAPWEIIPNIVVDEGILYLLNAGLAQGSQATALYIALFGGATTPANTLTAATFAGVQTEFTNYTETTRVVWAKDAAAANSIGNTTTPALFTMATGGGTVRGAALIATASGKGATTGTLIAAAKFPSDKIMSAGEELRIRYTIAGSSS